LAVVFSALLAAVSSTSVFTYNDTLAFTACEETKGQKSDFTDCEVDINDVQWVSAFYQPMLIKTQATKGKEYLATTISFETAIITVTDVDGENVDPITLGAKPTPDDVDDPTGRAETIGEIQARVVVLDSLGNPIPTFPQEVLLLRQKDEIGMTLKNVSCLVDGENPTNNCTASEKNQVQDLYAESFTFFTHPVVVDNVYIDVQYRLLANVETTTDTAYARSLMGTAVYAAEVRAGKIDNADL
jgi:hypothetical protein